MVSLSLLVLEDDRDRVESCDVLDRELLLLDVFVLVDENELWLDDNELVDWLVLVDDVPVELLDDDVDVLDVLVLVDSLEDVLNSPMYHETLLTVDEYPSSIFVC